MAFLMAVRDWLDRFPLSFMFKHTQSRSAPLDWRLAGIKSGQVDVSSCQGTVICILKDPKICEPEATKHELRIQSWYYDTHINIYHIVIMLIPYFPFASFNVSNSSQIARSLGPIWGPPGSCWPQMGPMLAPWTLLSGVLYFCQALLYPLSIDVLLTLCNRISTMNRRWHGEWCPGKIWWNQSSWCCKNYYYMSNSGYTDKMHVSYKHEGSKHWKIEVSKYSSIWVLDSLSWFVPQLYWHQQIAKFVLTYARISWIIAKYLLNAVYFIRRFVFTSYDFIPNDRFRLRKLQR